MTLLFERILDFVQAWISHILPWAILGDDQVGIVRRLGCYRRKLHHGLNWKWPVIEEALKESSALDSMLLREQSLTTADGHQVTLRGVMTYHIVSARKYILGVNDPESVVNDVGCCVIAEVVPTRTLDDVLQDDSFNEELLCRVRERGKKWGIKIDYFGLADRVAASTVRLIGLPANARGNAG